MTQVLTNYEMRDRLAAAVREAGTASLFAKIHGVQMLHVAKVLTGKCPPCKRLEMALGLRGATRYVVMDAAPMTVIDACQRTFERAQSQPAMSRPERIQDKLRIARALAGVDGA